MALVTALADQREQAAQEMKRQAQVASDIARTAEMFNTSVGGLLASQSALEASMRQLGEINLKTGFHEFAGALAAQSREIRSLTDTMTGFVPLTQAALSSQESLQRAVGQLHEADFNRTLDGFRASLSSLGDVLVRFREPFVLQAVPVLAERTASNLGRNEGGNSGSHP
jgi:hypothetical protein